MSNCIFCKIIKKEIPATIVYEDDLILAFEDIRPQAKVHTLVIPKLHIEDNLALETSHKDLIGHIFLKINTIAKLKGIDKTGFRVLNNCGRHGGQEVFHVHWHILGGEPLGRMVCR